MQHRLPAGLYRTFYLCHSSVGTVEFDTHLSVLFGLQPNYRRAAMFRDIKEHVLNLNNSAHVHPVLLIDEAHLLSTEILSEIRLLTNFSVDSFNALTVLLCGSENLTRKFGLSVLEALSADESFSFVDSRMRACGAQNPVFTKNALTLLHQASGGTLRTLGSIANATLMQAFTARSSQVEAEHVQQVIQR